MFNYTKTLMSLVEQYHAIPRDVAPTAESKAEQKDSTTALVVRTSSPTLSTAQQKRKEIIASIITLMNISHQSQEDPRLRRMLPGIPWNKLEVACSLQQIFISKPSIMTDYHWESGTFKGQISPIAMMATCNDRSLFELFHQLGNKIDFSDNQQVSPLHMCSFYGSDETLEYLLSFYGANPAIATWINQASVIKYYANSNENYYARPLVDAFLANHSAVVKLLLLAGAKTDLNGGYILNNYNLDKVIVRTATSLALYNPDNECAKLILAHNALQEALKLAENFDKNPKQTFALQVKVADALGHQSSYVFDYIARQLAQKTVQSKAFSTIIIQIRLNLLMLEATGDSTLMSQFETALGKKLPKMAETNVGRGLQCLLEGSSSPSSLVMEPSSDSSTSSPATLVAVVGARSSSPVHSPRPVATSTSSSLSPEPEATVTTMSPTS